MALTIKYFDRSCLPRVAIFVGCLHILGSIWNIIGASYEILRSDADFVQIIDYDAIIKITVALLFIIAAALLLIGTYKKSHLMFLPWLVLEGFSLVLYFVYYAIRFIYSHTRNWDTFSVLMVNFSIIGLCVYVWFAILSFYQILRDEKQKPIPDDQEKLCDQPIPVQVRDRKPYPPPYVIPIAYSDPKQPVSQIKY